MEDLVNTGHELMEMCTDEDASDIKEEVDNISSKYDQVKSTAREKLNQLDEAFRGVTTDVSNLPSCMHDFRFLLLSVIYPLLLLCEL